MASEELEKKTAQNRRRIDEINEILTKTEYETIEQVQTLRLEKQRLEDEIPLLERELGKIKAKQREEALEKTTKQLASIIKKAEALEVEIYTNLIEIMKDATSLDAMRQEYYKITPEFPELTNRPGLSFPSHAFEDPVIRKIVESDTPRPSAKTWKKIEKEWYEARKRFHSYES